MGKRRGFFAVLLFTALYLFLTGLKVSLLRAAVMFFLMGTARYLGREPRPLRALGGAFLVALLLDPSSVATPGFQLSFGALAGILIVGKPLAAAGGALIPFGPGRALGQGVGISLGAQLVTAPLLLFWFGEMVITGFLASLVVTPVVTVYLFAGLGFLLLSPVFGFPWTGYLTGLMEKGYSLVEAVVLLFYHSPSWSPRTKMVQYLLVVLVAAVVYRQGRKRLGHHSVRLTRTDQSFHGGPGVGHDKEVRAKLSHQPRSPEETA
jgi:competence protein ComEC